MAYSLFSLKAPFEARETMTKPRQPFQNKAQTDVAGLAGG